MVFAAFQNRTFGAAAFFASATREFEDHACRHIAMLEPVEDSVDRRERLKLDIGL